MGKPPKHGMGFSQHFVVPQNMESAQPKWTSMCQNPRTYNILQHYLIVRKSSGKTKGLVYLKKRVFRFFLCFSKGFSHGFFPFSSFDPCHGDWGTRLGRSRHAKAQFLDGVMENPEKCIGGPAL